MCPGLLVPGLQGLSGSYSPLSQHSCGNGVCELSGFTTGVDNGWGPGTAEMEPKCFLFSKGIADYITRCKQAIGKFESLVHQIHKNAEDINSRLTLIESINLFRSPVIKTEDKLPGRPGL